MFLWFVSNILIMKTTKIFHKFPIFYSFNSTIFLLYVLIFFLVLCFLLPSIPLFPTVMFLLLLLLLYYVAIVIYGTIIVKLRGHISNKGNNNYYVMIRFLYHFRFPTSIFILLFLLYSLFIVVSSQLILS